MPYISTSSVVPLFQALIEHRKSLIQCVYMEIKHLKDLQLENNSWFISTLYKNNNGRNGSYSTWLGYLKSGIRIWCNLLRHWDDYF